MVKPGLIIYRFLLRAIMSVYLMLMYLLNKINSRKRCLLKKKNIVLATATFYSDNWIITHLQPLAENNKVDVLYFVASSKVPQIDKVIPIYPNKIVAKYFGKTGSRLITFAIYSLRLRPDILVGFHLLINGLLASFLARIIGAMSIYICGGGAREVAGGGFDTESKIFRKILYPDVKIEKMLLSSMNYIDKVITMGEGAKAFFVGKGVTSDIYVHPGGIDENVFRPDDKVVKEYDIVFVGRLSKVKRFERIIEAVRKLRDEKDVSYSVLVVGEGPESPLLQNLIAIYGLENNFYFAGWQNNIAEWLTKAKIFTLTSESEGLSQALLQALMCGLPAVVSDVGDLSEAVVHGENGFLVPVNMSANNELFSDYYYRLLSDNELYMTASKKAYESSKFYSMHNACRRWDSIF